MLRLNHQLVTIETRDNKIIITLPLNSGGAIELMPLDNDLRGHITALSIASDIIAGKFWPNKIVSTSANKIVDNNNKTSKEKIALLR